MLNSHRDRTWACGPWSGPGHLSVTWRRGRPTLGYLSASGKVVREARAGGTAPLTQGQRWWREAEGTLQQGPEGGTGTQSSDLATEAQDVHRVRHQASWLCRGLQRPSGSPDPRPEGHGTSRLRSRGRPAGSQGRLWDREAGPHLLPTCDHGLTLRDSAQQSAANPCSLQEIRNNFSIVYN